LKCEIAPRFGDGKSAPLRNGNFFTVPTAISNFKYPISKRKNHMHRRLDLMRGARTQ
jgi:hypothetical protein